MSELDHERRVHQLLSQTANIKNGIISFRRRRRLDQFVFRKKGLRGNCALCGKYGVFSFDHVPPKCTGNMFPLQTRSYMTALKGNEEYIFGPRFPYGMGFYTICNGCNSALGGREDKEIERLFVQAKRMFGSPLLVSDKVKLTVRPSLLFRGLMAHILAANDNGAPDQFDDAVRSVFLKGQNPRESGWNLYYWPYMGEEIFLLRAAFMASYVGGCDINPIYIMKVRPFGFAFCSGEMFRLPNLREFLLRDIDAETQIPFSLRPYDMDPVWPARPSDRNNRIIFAGSNCFGLIGSRI